MMSEDNFQDISLEMKEPPAVVLGDESLPRLYEDSEISMSQLPRQHGIVKRAVALGRYLLNPLAMVATLCGIKQEVVSWKLNPLEEFLTSDEKLEIIEWVMTDVTNQFVSGLGPRKAGILHRELLAGTDVRNRRDFAKFGLNTKKVFCNAVGFLKVSCDDPNFVDTVGNILDRTRIHPESYKLAEELARAVHRHNNLETPNANATEVIEYIQNDPKLLEGFDLIEYADRLEIEKGEYRRVTLFDIKMELLHGFEDPRRPYNEPTQDEEFCMITGETGDALVEGKRVQATVRHVQSQQAFCVLDSGMTGILLKDDFSDETEDMTLTDKLHEGVVLTCKIKLIDRSRCRVNLTCKESELKNDGEQSFHDMDPYYCQGNLILPSQQEATDKKELVNKNFMPRMISHSHFQNITADQAEEFLADKAVGEYIFHPSSRGLCYLTLSLKIFNGLYVHKDILEGGKGHDLKSLYGLGKTLKVGDEIFEDIDKVIEHYVNPLFSHLQAMFNFRKFKKGSKAEVDELLKLEKDEFPNRIPYGFGISYEHPGIFILSYIRSTNPHHEFVAIHPKGFKFRKQIFKNVEQLVAYFQNHINDNVARSKNNITDGSFRESRGWKSNNVDQHKQSIEVLGGQREESIGTDYTNDGGTGWTNANSSGWKDNNGGTGWANAKSSGWKDNNSKSWGEGGPGEGSGRGATGFSKQNSHGSDWNEATGCTNDGGTGWTNANSSAWKDNNGGTGRGNAKSSGWKDNNGKSWGEGGPGEDGGTGWTNANSSGWKDNNGGTGWANAKSSGWKDNNSKSWGEGGPGEGSGRGATGFSKQNSHGSDWNEATGCTNDGGSGWTNANSSAWKDNSGGTGWDNAKSSGWKDNNGKNWGEGGPGEGSGRGATGFSKQNSHGSDWNAGTGCTNDGGTGWTNANSSGWKDNNGGTGWANANSSGWKDNNGKSWGEGRGRGGRWGGNNTNETEGSWGLSFADNAECGNGNTGWSAAHGKNATPSGGVSGWGGTGDKSW
ncbi:YqgF/RNase H-like domain superfamily [Sesbania bispinosa]|nr:YqgF/RNase H-like domain superfamily [Sesbania bispinosa]